MRKGKLGIPRPFGIGLQFSTNTGRDQNIPDLLRSDYEDLTDDMVSRQESGDSEVLSVCYNDNDTWKHTDIISGKAGKITKPRLYDIDDLEFNRNSDLMNKAFTIHTHPSYDNFISGLSLNDLLACLTTVNTYRSKYIGEGALVSHNGGIVLTSITTPKDISTEDKDNMWRIENALEDFLERLQEGKIDGIGGTNKFEEPIRIPGYGLSNEFDSIDEVRDKTKKELSAIGFKIQSTRL